jgi:hypothetical protein
MKKVIFAALMLTAVSTLATHEKSFAAYSISKFSGGGTHIPASEVPRAVKVSFNTRYQNARNVQWQIEREDGRKVYQAEFTLNGVRWKAQFLPDGTFLGQQRA